MVDDAGVVDEDVESACFLPDLFCGGLDGFRGGDVELDDGDGSLVVCCCKGVDEGLEGGCGGLALGRVAGGEEDFVGEGGLDEGFDYFVADAAVCSF